MLEAERDQLREENEKLKIERDRLLEREYKAGWRLRHEAGVREELAREGLVERESS